MQTRVTIDESGSIALPAAVLRALGLAANDELIVEQTAEGLLLRPSRATPLENYSEERIAEFQSDEDAIGRRLRKSE